MTVKLRTNIHPSGCSGEGKNRGEHRGKQAVKCDCLSRIPQLVSILIFCRIPDRLASMRPAASGMHRNRCTGRKFAFLRTKNLPSGTPFIPEKGYCGLRTRLLEVQNRPFFANSDEKGNFPSAISGKSAEFQPAFRRKFDLPIIKMRIMHAWGPAAVQAGPEKLQGKRLKEGRAWRGAGHTGETPEDGEITDNYEN